MNRDITVSWMKCTGNVWCTLEYINLQTVSGSGVYVLWNGTQTIYVGQGDISNRLSSHRNDNQIMRHNRPNKILATWAIVPANQQDGIERYLADRLNPVEGSHHPNVQPIPVNLPGQ